MTDKIVSIGLLTGIDLARLGKSFTRHFPIVEDELFDDLSKRGLTAALHAEHSPG